MNLLKPGRVAAIRSLLVKGQASRRAIAREVGADRSTVAAMVAGPHPRESLRRCPDCGGIVEGRCKACGLKRRLQKRRFQPIDEPADGDLSLELHGGARKRYQRLYRRKVSAGQPVSEDAA